MERQPDPARPLVALGVARMSEEWRTSSYSASGNCVQWRTSSYSASMGDCVQVRCTQVRDSKDPDGPVLSFQVSAWGEFLAAVKAGVAGEGALTSVNPPKTPRLAANLAGGLAVLTCGFP